MKKAETACSDIMEEEGSSSQQNSSNVIQMKILNKTNQHQNSLSNSEENLTKVHFYFILLYSFFNSYGSPCCLVESLGE